MNQPSLFSEPIDSTWDREPPSVRDSETSIAAAKAIEPICGKARRAVYDFLLARGAKGGTDEEIQDGIPMNPSTQRPRRGELVEAGWVKASGQLREVRSGNMAVVWIVARREA